MQTKLQTSRVRRTTLMIILSVIVVLCLVAGVLWGFSSAVSSFVRSVWDDLDHVVAWQPLRNEHASHIESFKIPFGETTRNVKVYLPKDYDLKTQTTYPTLYLLHGKGGDETDWLNQGDAQKTLDTAIQNGTIQPLIVIFPDGNGSKIHHTQYINSADGKELNEDLVAKDLVKLIDTKYRTKNDAKFRAIGGNSAGGFGALNIGLKHQDTFGEIMAFSGYGRLLTYSSPSLIQGSQTVIDNNTPLTYIKKLPTHSVKIWMTIGSSDSSAFIEDHTQLRKALTAAHFENDITIIDGAHDWDFWGHHLRDGLEWLGKKWEIE